MPSAQHLLPELFALERIIELGAGRLKSHVACEIKLNAGQVYPVHVITLGNPSLDVPAVGYFGGIHGLERIGASVVIAYLNSLVMRLQWDSTLHKQLESVRLVFMPLVNPGGMALGTRAEGVTASEITACCPCAQLCVPLRSRPTSHSE